MRCKLIVLAIATLTSLRAYGADKEFSFDSVSALSGWKTDGGATFDDSRNHSGSASGSLKIAPGSLASFHLRDSNGSGRVELWIYDDCSKPLDPKLRRAGARWGIEISGGSTLAVGALYAPYLSGDTTYCVTNYKEDSTPSILHDVQYLGIDRDANWHDWVFDFDPIKGLAISCDGKDVNAAKPRFDWSKTTATGFSGITVIGDEAGSGATTFWVDDIKATVGGPMTASPTSMTGERAVLPEKDPALEGPPVELNADVMSVHPRLLFSPKDLPRLRTFYKSEEAAPIRESIEKLLPACVPTADTKFTIDATDAQRQGFWRSPTVAMHYAMTGDKQSFDHAYGYLKLFQNTPHWETDEYFDSEMSAANIMLGAAITYDLLYNELPEDFREAFRKTLWYHARAMYYGGHLEKVPAMHFWQNDPLNNHRFHNDTGLILCAMAASTGSADEQWLIREIFNEFKFFNTWLPEDGSSHESENYMVFGASHVTLADNVADRCFGTHYLQAPYFQHIADFVLQCLTPGMKNVFQYGDSSDGPAFYWMFSLKTASDQHQANTLGSLMRLMKISPSAFSYQWLSVPWLDPSIKIDTEALPPLTSFFSDEGLAFMRDGWESKNVGAMFKCGPLGGYKLNDFRKAFATPESLRYINVAHDDPDANSFQVWSNGGFVAESDRYSQHKKSANHNTILINGMGQMVPGHMEDQVYSQPAVGNNDMRKMAVVLAHKDAGVIDVIDGEASGAYLEVSNPRTNQSRPALDRYRRTFIWVKGGYLLVLDDIRAPQAVDLTWLLQAPKLEQGSTPLAFTLRDSNASCEVQIVAVGDEQLTANIGVSPADNKSDPLKWQQLRLSARADHFKLVTLLKPWGGDAKVALHDADGAMQIDVTESETDGTLHDTWSWTPAVNNDTATGLTCHRVDGTNYRLN